MEYKFQGVLDWVNQVRAEHKIGEPLTELPKGRPMNGDCCPIARSFAPFDASTTRANTLLWDTRDYITHPEGVSAFIKDFDNGEHPELVEETA